MRRAAALLVAGAVAGAVLAVSGIAFGGTDIKIRQTLRFVARQDQFQAFDRAPSGPSLGDQTFASAVLNRNGTAAGSLDLTCGLTHVVSGSTTGNRYTCTGTARLTRGQVTLTGTIPTGSLESASRFSVTGGTADFRNARGQAINKTLSSTSSKLTLYLIP
jgi:hypothetical protein